MMPGYPFEPMVVVHLADGRAAFVTVDVAELLMAPPDGIGGQIFRPRFDWYGDSTWGVGNPFNFYDNLVVKRIGSGPAFSWKLHDPFGKPKAEGSASCLVEAVQAVEAASIRINGEPPVDAEPDRAVPPAGDRPNLAH